MTREPASDDVMVLMGLSIRPYWERSRFSITLQVCCHYPTTRHSFSKCIHSFPKMINRGRNVQLWGTRSPPLTKALGHNNWAHSGLASGITNSALIWPRSPRWASAHKQAAPLCRAQQASCDAAALVRYLPDANNGADSNARLLQVDWGGLLSDRGASSSPSPIRNLIKHLWKINYSQ